MIYDRSILISLLYYLLVFPEQTLLTRLFNLCKVKGLIKNPMFFIANNSQTINCSGVSSTKNQTIQSFDDNVYNFRMENIH